MSTAPNPTPGVTRPAFPTLQTSGSSQASSAFQSYSSGASFSTPSSASSAPLPSPSTARPPQHGFFGSLDGQQQAQQQPQPQQQRQPLQRYPTFEYQPNRDGAGRTAAETASYLNQAALLAEAAKRAQMAVVMRDLDGMEL